MKVIHLLMNLVISEELRFLSNKKINIFPCYDYLYLYSP